MSRPDDRLLSSVNSSFDRPQKTMVRPTAQEKYDDPNPVVRFVIGRFFRRLRGVLSELGPHSILDAGCGEGEMLRRGVLPSTVKPVCVDLDSARLALVAGHDRVRASV